MFLRSSQDTVTVADSFSDGKFTEISTLHENRFHFQRREESSCRSYHHHAPLTKLRTTSPISKASRLQLSTNSNAASIVLTLRFSKISKLLTLASISVSRFLLMFSLNLCNRFLKLINSS